ncbi:restriction endonuclease subunit S [Streptomyces ossamyceticus]|uniref:restriction endonuclease subunit S n=1 Tax=Streptomyces ossamyceticus TaxID=249581 RepID=UPI0036E3D853
MSVEWLLRRLTDVVSLPKGQVSPLEPPYRSQFLLAPDHVESGTGEILRLETAESQGAISGKYVVHPGDVVFSKIRPALRKVALADFTGICSADMYPLRPGVEVAGEFIKAVLLGDRFSRYVESLSGRTGIPKVNRGDLEGFWFPVPPLDEQQRIVDVIASIDRLIARTLHEREKRELVQKGVLSDFLKPVDSDSSRRWMHGNFGDFVRLQRGFDITVAEQRPGAIPVVSSSGISSYHDIPKVKGPGVVTGRKGKLGGVYYLEGSYWPHDTSLWVTDFKGNDPYFVAIYMREMHLERYDAATSVPTLNRNVVHNLPVSFPDRVRQRELAALMRAFAANSAALQEEVTKLQRLKQGLVDDLLSGRVEVSAVSA